jgi:hypothetical protein
MNLFLPRFAYALLDYSDHSSMADQEFKEVDDETCARGVKRTSDNKTAEVSTRKSKKRTKKAQAETPEPLDG